MYGGPEKYTFGVINLLEKNGHEVIPFSVKNPKNQKTKYSKYFVDAIGGNDKVFYEEYKKTPKTIYQLLERQIYSFEVKRKLNKLIKDNKPDVAYILHHANKLSPSVIDACKKEGVPTVVRISDFSLLCVDHFLLRDGKVCEKCIEKNPLQSVKFGCVKNSKLASLVKSSSLILHRYLKTYQKVDHFVVPSNHTIKKLSVILDKDKMTCVPTPVNKQNKQKKIGDYILCVGRLEEEKGFIYAIKAVEGTNIKLKISGNSHTGYGNRLFDYVKKKKLKNIEFLGLKSQEELQKIYADARLVVIPGIWYENLPNVSLEAMAHSNPLVVSDLGSMKEIVENGYNGYRFPKKNHKKLRELIISLLDNNSELEKFGKNSYKNAISTYSPENHYKKLINIFKQVTKN